MWSAVANIQFTEISAATAAANPLLAALDFQSNVGGGTYESSGNKTPSPIGSGQLYNQGAGTFLTVDIGPNGFDVGNFNDGGSGVGVILHEEGHFLGLGHSGPYNGAVDFKTQQYSAYDTHQYSLMSYIAANEPTAKYNAENPNPGATDYGDSTTWMPLDILAVQRLYGAATTGPLSGGQVFGYHDNVDGLVAGVGIHDYFDFSAITVPVVTLYDTGTGNTLDLSGDHSAETIDLRPGHYSSFAGDTDNLAIAYNTAIDTFVGGTAGETVTTNADADILTGGIGGANTAVFSGALSNYTLSQNGGVETVTNTTTGVTDTLTNFQTLQFSDQSVAVPCFYAGTRIATPDGERAIETLSTDDLVLTADGEARPVRWLGRSTVSMRFHDPLRGFPIRILAGALGEGLPKRDLLVSPDHAMFVCGSLIQAGALVNDVTIVRETRVPEVFTYYHLELDEHLVILAEGAATESFVDNLDRMAFDNWDEHPAPKGEEMAELPYARAKSARQLPASVCRLIAGRIVAMGKEKAVAA